MKIENNLVVSIDYTLKNDAGEVVDTSDGRGPLTYIQGIGNLIPGLEKELEGQEVGFKKNVVILPKEAYGIRDEKLVQIVPLKNFEKPDEVRPGTQFQLQIDKEVKIATVTKVVGEEVELDLNHPMAGATLYFDVEVKDIRTATEEELAHGHVHGPDGHHHH